MKRKFVRGIGAVGFAFMLHSALALPVFAADETCKIADTAITDASTIRKLKIRKSVPCFVHDKDKVKGYLLHAIETKIPAQKLKMEEVVYKALGLLPAGFDYQKGIVDLYLGQIGGYYDPEGKHFVMAGWLPAMMQTTVAVHELTHALQDQHFNLETFMDEKRLSGDELMARSALVEGDATAVMLDYARGLVGQPGIEKEKDVESIMLQNLISSSLVAGMSNVPQSLQMMLIFPYTSGLRFAHALLESGSYAAIDKAFKRPPRSTEEILHPQKYLSAQADFEKFDPQSLRPKEVSTSISSSYQDSLGEFVISTLLAGGTVDKNVAALAAAGWAGDEVAVFDDTAAAKRYVVWKTKWDSASDAEEFFELYVTLLSRLYSGFALRDKNTALLPGKVRLEKSGLFVDLLITQPLQ